MIPPGPRVRERQRRNVLPRCTSFVQEWQPNEKCPLATTLSSKGLQAELAVNPPPLNSPHLPHALRPHLHVRTQIVEYRVQLWC
jgi:hypothetical protein